MDQRMHADPVHPALVVADQSVLPAQQDDDRARPSISPPAVHELPGDSQEGGRRASMPAVHLLDEDDDQLEWAETRVDVASRWLDVQRALIHKQMATVQTLQQRSLTDFDTSIHNPTNQQLQMETGKMMPLMHQYVHQLRQMAQSQAVDDRVTQASTLIRQLRAIESDFIIRLQSSMEKAYRTLYPDASAESIATLSILPALPSYVSFGMAALVVGSSMLTDAPHQIALHDYSPDARTTVRTLEDRHQSMLDAKKRLTALDYLWNNTMNEMRSVQSPRSSRTTSFAPTTSVTVIAPNGDTVLEFGDPSGYKFRVSSQVLSQASTFFDYALTPYRPHQVDPRSPPPVNMEYDLENTELVRASPTAPARLHLKLDKHITFEAISILLYAAHMRIDKVPRNISFQEFVDVASACYKYRCTLPVEIFVERVWLEQWIDCLGVKGYDEFLFISYVFGLSRIFEETSKRAIMLLQNSYGALQEDSRLPLDAWLHLRQVRAARLRDILQLCRKTMNSYVPIQDGGSTQASRPVSYSDADPLANAEMLQLKRQPRCPHGSYQCDAFNLGWLMLVLNEVGVLPAVLDPSKEDDLMLWQTNSLKRILCKLSAAPSAIGVHGDACDYAPAFRNSMCDIYNNIRGVNIWDINDRMTTPRASANTLAGGSITDDASTYRQDTLRPARSRRPTSNGASLPGTNTPKRLSHQSNERSEGDTSRGTTSDGNTDLTETSNESWPSRLSRQNLETLQAETRSVVSTEVDIRTDRCISPTLTTESVQTSHVHPRLHDSDQNSPASASPHLDGEATVDAHESAKTLSNRREVVTRADKARIMSEGHLSVVQQESGLRSVENRPSDSGSSEVRPGPSTEPPTESLEDGSMTT